MPSTRAHLFNKSPYYDKQALQLAFFGTKYEQADLDYYHEKADIWSNKGPGNKKIDWLATIRNWMCDALKDGKLVYKTHKELDKTVAEVQTNLTNIMTNWQKDGNELPKPETTIIETPPMNAPQPQQAKQLEIPTDWSEHWEDLQEKARKGISMIIVIPVYNWLCETGRMSLSKDEKIDVFMRAKFHFMGELEGNPTPQNRHKLRTMKTEGWGNDKELLTTVTIKAKIMAARDYLYLSIQPQHSSK